MITADDICPAPDRCIKDVLRDIELFAPNPDRNVREIADWLRALLNDRESLGVLDSARGKGADVPRLLLAGAIYRGDRVWLDGPLANVKIGLPGGVGTTYHDINEMLDHAEGLDRALLLRSAATEELRAMKTDLDRRDEDVRRHAGEPRPYLVPDGKGGWVQKHWIAHGAFVAVSQGEIGPAHGALQKGRGTHGEHALDVLIILVMGHLQAVTHRPPQPTFVVDVVLRGLRIGEADARGGADDVRGAMRVRLDRCRGDKRQRHRERAQIIARMLRLPYEPA